MAGRSADHVWVRGKVNHVETVEKKIKLLTEEDTETETTEFSVQMTIVPPSDSGSGDNLVGSRAQQVVGVVPSSSKSLLDFTHVLPLLGKHVLAYGSNSPDLPENNQFMVEAFSPFTSDSDVEDLKLIEHALTLAKRRRRPSKPPVVGNDATMSRGIHDRNLPPDEEKKVRSHFEKEGMLTPPPDPSSLEVPPEVSERAGARTIDDSPAHVQSKPHIMLNLSQVDMQDPRSRIALALKDKQGAQQVFGQDPSEYLKKMQEERNQKQVEEEKNVEDKE